MEIDRKFLKKLWNDEKVMCPNCNKEYLIPLHKKRKDNDDFKCPNCDKIYRTISILNNMLKNGK